MCALVRMIPRVSTNRPLPEIGCTPPPRVVHKVFTSAARVCVLSVSASSDGVGGTTAGAGGTTGVAATRGVFSFCGDVFGGVEVPMTLCDEVVATGCVVCAISGGKMV